MLPLQSVCATVLALSLSGCLEDPIPGPGALEWNQVEWSQGTLHFALVRPVEEGTGPHPVIFALPWGSGSATLVESFVQRYWLTEPAARGYYVIAPEVHGPTLEGAADEIIPAIFAWMEANLSFDASKVALVGASNGGRGIFFAALSQPDRFQTLLGLPGQYGGEAVDLAVLVGKPIWLLVGELDPGWVTGTQATIALLQDVGITAVSNVVPNQGHVLDLNDAQLLDWIDEALGR